MTNPVPEPVPQACVAVPVPYVPSGGLDAARIVTFLGQTGRQGHAAVLTAEEARAVWEYVAGLVGDLMRYEGGDDE